MVCRVKHATMTVKPDQLLSDVIAKIKDEHSLNKPGFNLVSGDTLYIPHPPALEAMHSHKLGKTLRELLD